jgi:hypothetical protein
MSDSALLDSLSLEDAVQLFKQWGFQVEPGPRPEEVTLIIDAPDHRTYSVHPADMLPRMSAVALRVRRQQTAPAGMYFCLPGRETAGMR